MNLHLNNQLNSLRVSRTNIDWYLNFLSDEWLIGFIEAEATFSGSKTGVLFSLSQSSKDKLLIQAIAIYLGLDPSVVVKDKSDGCSYLTLTNRSLILKHIIPLLNGRLRSFYKHQQFSKWCLFYFEFQVLPLNLEPLSLNWLIGFVDGDGSFFWSVKKDSSYRHGFQLSLVFDIAQRIEDISLLSRISEQFFSNSHHWALSKGVQHLRIVSFGALSTIVEPLFSKCNFLTRRSHNFLLWKEVLFMMKNKQHLDLIGIAKAKELKTYFIK